MTTDVKLLPLPDDLHHHHIRMGTSEHHAAAQAYARANVAHATAAKDAEIEALWADVAHVVAGMNAAFDKVIEHRNARHDAEARAERLAEAMDSLADEWGHNGWPDPARALRAALQDPSHDD